MITQGYEKEKLWQSRTPKKENSADIIEDNHQPKICEKSKHIDQAKRKMEIPRYEMLNRIVFFVNQGQEYSNKKKRHIKERIREEELELKSLSFRPDCRRNSLDKNIVSEFGADIVDRNQKWAQRKEEKLQLMKDNLDKSVDAACSFKPNTVLPFKQNNYQREQMDDESQYCSSVFVKDGIKNYFTRLEQARKMKKEAQFRLGKFRLKRKLGKRPI